MSDQDGILLVVDDAGLPFDNPDGTGVPVPFDAYLRVLDLAQRFGVTIPVATTAGFIDVNNISGLGLASPHAERLVAFLDENRCWLPIWCHGLTHRFGTSFTEFDLYDNEGGVPAGRQSEILERSRGLFASLGLDPPSVLVPPGHAWQPGVTDRLARAAGFDTIAIRQFEKTTVGRWLCRPSRRYKRTWSDSSHLNTLYRLGLGLRYNKRDMSAWDLSRCKRYIFSTRPVVSAVLHRRLSVETPHHFFAHIQNFSSADSMVFWKRIMEQLLARYGRRVGA